MDYRVDFEKVPWQSPLPGMRFRIHELGGQWMRVVEYTDDFVEPDWCRRGHVGYVLEGEFDSTSAAGLCASARETAYSSRPARTTSTKPAC